MYLTMKMITDDKVHARDKRQDKRSDESDTDSNLEF